MANRMSLFYAEATPMLKTLSNATTKFVSEVRLKSVLVPDLLLLGVNTASIKVKSFIFCCGLATEQGAAQFEVHVEVWGYFMVLGYDEQQ